MRFKSYTLAMNHIMQNIPSESNLTIGQRIRLIRESTGLGRTRFSRLIGCKESSLVATENIALSCNSTILEAVSNIYPQYALWLITGKADPECQQIAPPEPETVQITSSRIYTKPSNK